MGKAFVAVVAAVVVAVVLVITVGGWNPFATQLDSNLSGIKRFIDDQPAPQAYPTGDGIVTLHNNLAVPVAVTIDGMEAEPVDPYMDRQYGLVDGSHVVGWTGRPPTVDGVALGRTLSGKEPRAISGTRIATSAQVDGVQAFSPVVSNELPDVCSVAVGSAADPTDAVVTTAPGDSFRSLGYFALDATSFVLVDCPQGHLAFGAAASDPSANPIEVDPSSGAFTLTLSTATIGGS